MDYPITVNGQQVQTSGGRYNGRKIRQFGGVPDDHDLWLKMPGMEGDLRFGDDDVIPTHPPLEFYSAPREINGA